ncbi:MAG: alpha/beta hydrolase [Burkholderiaceae bacterium]|nr:alpha/beta hydrolase [Burkholderiaceae bacterium]
MAGFFARVTEGLFFQTDKRPYWDFTHFGLKGEHVRLAGPNHSELAGLFLPAFFSPENPDSTPKGTVLFAHSCLHNMQFHLPQIIWLVAAGFNVFTYDPRGCGQSQGSIDLDTVAADIEHAWDYLIGRDDVDETKIIVFGQFVGAYAALRLTERRSTMAGMVLESIWATQAGWLLTRYGPGIGHCLRAMCPKRANPIDALRALSMPVALAAGSHDTMIPDAELSLVMKALPAHREIWLESGARYLDIFPRPSGARERFLAFAESILNK